MLPRGELRWAGSGISNGRLRLANIPASSRYFSVHASSRHISRSSRPSIIPKNLQSVQVRSLSLFGWGGSSKSPTTDGSVLPTSSDVHNIELGPTSLSNVRSIKASHDTSDAPDPSLVPDSADGVNISAVERLTEAIASPAGSDQYNQLLEDTTPITTTAEYIGYLRETCGLDYGWGPSSVMQFLYEHIHISGALSWTASIMVLSTILRLTMVPTLILSQKEAQKMKEIAPYATPLREKYQGLIAEGNRTKAAEVMTEMRALNKAANVKYSRMLIPILIQFPFQFGAFRMLRGSADLPVPAYIEQPWLWAADLSLSDPYYLAPAISAGFIYFQFQQSQKQQTLSASSPVTPNMMKVMGRVIPVASFGFMFWQPGAVQLYFVVSSFMAFSTAWLLRQPAARRLVGLESLAPSTTSATINAVNGPVKKSASIGGLQSKPRLAAEPVKVEAPAAPVPDRSLIDKGVDRLKSMVSTSTPGKGAIRARTEKAVEKRQQKMQKERAMKYEQDHKRKLNLLREERNRELKSGQA